MLALFKSLPALDDNTSDSSWKRASLSVDENQAALLDSSLSVLTSISCRGDFLVFSQYGLSKMFVAAEQRWSGDIWKLSAAPRCTGELVLEMTGLYDVSFMKQGSPPMISSKMSCFFLRPIISLNERLKVGNLFPIHWYDLDNWFRNRWNGFRPTDPSEFPSEDVLLADKSFFMMRISINVATCLGVFHPIEHFKITQNWLSG